MDRLLEEGDDATALAADSRVGLGVADADGRGRERHVLTDKEEQVAAFGLVEVTAQSFLDEREDAVEAIPHIHGSGDGGDDGSGFVGHGSRC